ncbi:4-hydroxy-tetrahydrodipicolinate synthase [Burkholderiaceae bacterium DAT-1]|nr:4-hydroxy-tetrahydrodipicolinate synthase [Burkholderiaceae bacterium DAT-1]
MKKQHLKPGIWVAMVTPFKHGEIDFAAVPGLVNYLIEGGISGLVVCGTTGEAPTLSDAEQDALLEAVLHAVAGRCGVIFGYTDNNTAAMVKRLPSLDRYPLAGLLIAPPPYSRPSQAGILAHYRALLAATRHAVVLYHIPYRTGVSLDIATCQTLAEHPQVVGIKEAGGGDMARLHALINDTPLQVFSGEDNLILQTTCMGGAGAIAASAHLHPARFQRMFDAIQSGDLDTARALDRSLQPVVRQAFAAPNPAPVKAALAQMGLMQNELRLPLMTMDDALAGKWADILAAPVQH